MPWALNMARKPTGALGPVHEVCRSWERPLVVR